MGLQFTYPFVLGARSWVHYDKSMISGGYKPDTTWWFQIFFIFTPIWGRFPFWLIFSNGLKPPTRWSYKPIILGYYVGWNFTLQVEVLAYETWGSETYFKCLATISDLGFAAGTANRTVNRSRLVKGGGNGNWWTDARLKRCFIFFFGGEGITAFSLDVQKNRCLQHCKMRTEHIGEFLRAKNSLWY